MIKYYSFLLYLLLLGLSSCKRALTPEDNLAYPLDISLQNLSETSAEISWTKTNLSNFKHYIVTRQVDTLKVDGNTDTSWVIIDANINKVIDKRFPTAGNFYYSVIASTDEDKTLKSKFLLHKRKDIVSFTIGVYDQLIPNPALNLIYLYAYGINEPTIQIIDVALATITKPIPLGKEISFAQSDVIFNEEMPNELIIIDLDAVYYYDARTMKRLNQLPKSDPTINSSISSALVINNLMYLTETDAYKTISVYNPESKAFLFDGNFKTGSFASFRMIRYLDKIKKIVMFNHSSNARELIAFSLKDGIIQDSFERVKSDLWGAFSAFGLSVAPDGSSFITSYSSPAYLMRSDDFKKIHTFTNANGNFTYSPDGKQIAYQGFNEEINVIDLTTFNVLYQYKNPIGIKSLDFYINNNQLHVISEKTGQQNFLIAKYKFN